MLASRGLNFPSQFISPRRLPTNSSKYWHLCSPGFLLCLFKAAVLHLVIENRTLVYFKGFSKIQMTNLFSHENVIVLEKPKIGLGLGDLHSFSLQYQSVLRLHKKQIFRKPSFLYMSRKQPKWGRDQVMLHIYGFSFQYQYVFERTQIADFQKTMFCSRGILIKFSTQKQCLVQSFSSLFATFSLQSAYLVISTV